jgi:hypothetical protein
MTVHIYPFSSAWAAAAAAVVCAHLKYVAQHMDPVCHLPLQGSPGPSSSSAAAAAGALAAGSNEDIEASIRQLELQGRPAGETEAGGHNSSGAGAAAAGSSAANSDVSQSRASSSIRVAKFHKVLNEPLVSNAAL